LPALAEDLEIALIPVNRAAGRRALARLAREVRRVTLGVGRNALPSSSDSVPSSRRASYASYPQAPGEAPAPRSSSHTFSREEDPTTARGQIPDELLKQATPVVTNELQTVQFEATSRDPSPSQADVDSLISDFGVSGGADHDHARDLKAMAGLEPTPSPPDDRPRAPSSRPPASDDGVESLLSMADAPRPAPTPAGAAAARNRVAPPTPEPRTHPTAFSRGDAQLPTQPSHLKKMRASLPSAPQASSRRGSGLLMLLALMAVGGGAFAVWQLRPAEMKPPVEKPTASAVASAPSAHVAAACKATLIVTDVPVKAEVLLRQGQAPVDVEKMPVGARLEFVATSEGFAPKRLVVPAGATWDTGPDNKPRFEAAVQLDKSTAKAGTDPWPPAELGTEVGGQGPAGTIHVVATPRGAEIWMVAGMGPEAHVEQLRCDRDVDVLVAGPGAYRKRLRLAGGDFAIDAAEPAPSPGKATTRIARISAK
jgi:hypothetical protein